MKYIRKTTEPQCSTDWKVNNPNIVNYGSKNKKLQDLRVCIRRECLTEQHGLCGYCCMVVSEYNHNNRGSGGHNEHVIPQCSGHDSLDYSNIITSCNNSNTCGKHKKDSPLPLTPLQKECETELIFDMTGQIDKTKSTKNAIETARILNLDFYDESRKTAINNAFSLFNSPTELTIDNLNSIVNDAISFSPIIKQVLSSRASS